MAPQPSSSPAPHAIRVGPAGWSYSDWEGIVYPPHGSRFDHLAFLSGYFDTIEINSTFYRIPPVTHGRSWVKRVEANERFRFCVKLHRGFTHEASIPSDEDVSAFRALLDVMRDGGRLGAVLIQFPWSFKETGEGERRLEAIFRRFEGYPLALEVRHASFQNETFFEFLRSARVAFVNIDQPLFHDSVRPAAMVTSTPAYVRFHGRNHEKWFNHSESWERYDYLYSRRELAPWIERIGEMATAEEVYVITNNHFRGQAVVNAIDIKRGLGQPAEVPPQLAAAYGVRLEAR
ncbi:MAG TPA: DUF72 domain-containing protein [Thermoanaerobaculia bacterium]|nr:DUF72 domain-containing protein [Thermoanaerobaculia bacterium]